MATREPEPEEESNFILAPGEKTVLCPYNNVHLVTTTHLPDHLAKCRREYEKDCERRGKGRDLMMRTCRYNGSHKIHAPELELHEEGCAKKSGSSRRHSSDKKDSDRRSSKRKDSKSDRRRSRSGSRDEIKRHKHHHRDRDRDRDRSSDKDRHRTSGDRNSKIRRSSDRDKRPSREVVIHDYGHGKGVQSDKSNGHGHGHSSSKKSKHNVPPPIQEESIWGEDAEDWEAEAAANPVVPILPVFKLDPPPPAQEKKVVDVVYQPPQPQPTLPSNKPEWKYSKVNNYDYNQQQPENIEDYQSFKMERRRGSYDNYSYPEERVMDYPPPPMHMPMGRHYGDGYYPPPPPHHHHHHTHHPDDYYNNYNYPQVQDNYPMDEHHHPPTYPSIIVKKEPVDYNKHQQHHDSAAVAANTTTDRLDGPPDHMDIKPEIPPRDRIPPPKKKLEEMLESEEKEDGECSEEEFEVFLGEDPFS